MASGSFNLDSSTSRLKGKIEWSSQSNGAVANSSKVTATIYIARTDGYTTTGTWNYGLRVGSDVVFGDYYDSISDDWVAIRTLTNNSVAHNNDGIGTCFIECYVEGPSGTSMEGEIVNGNSTVTLDTIPRYTTITSFSVAKRNETSVTYTFATADTCDYAWYSTNDGSSWTGVDIADGTSGSFNVTGLSPNTTYNFKLKVRRKDNGLETISNRIQQTTYSVPSQSLSNKTETSIIMNWSVDSTADYIWYSTNNGSSWTAVGSVNATSGSYTINNLTANTSYNIKTRVRRKAPQTTYDTGTTNITTYNYPYVTAVGTSELTIGNSQTLTLYNPLSRSVTIKMYQNNTSGTELYSGTTSGTSITFTPTANTLYASIPSASNSYCVYSVIYGSSTKTTATNTYKYKIIGTEVPTFTNFAYADTNTTTTALTGNNQILVNNYSNVTATISTSNKAVANNSATMSNYVLTIGNQSAQANYNASSDVTMSINNIASNIIKVSANDSRGLSTAVTKTATIKNYVKPATTELTATRGNNGVGEQVTLAFRGTWWNDSFGSVSNAIQNIQYYFKKSDASAWTTGSTTITWTTNQNTFSGSLVVYGDTTTHGFDVTSSYYIKIVVTDKLDHSEEYQTTIGSGTPAIAIYKDNVAIGQQYNTSMSRKLQVNGSGVFYGNLDVQDGLNSTQTTEGGEIRLGAPRGSRAQAGTTIDNYNSTLRIFGIQSADGTSKAGVGIPFTIDPYAKTVTGGYTITGTLNGNASTATSATSATSATKATQDSDGTQINTNYSRAGVKSGGGFNDVGSGQVMHRSGLYSFNTDNAWYDVINIRHRNGEGDGTSYGLQIYSPMQSTQASLKIRNQSAGSWGSWDNIYRCKNLYNNSSGSNGSITLSESSANFTYLEIMFYSQYGNCYFSKKIYSPNGKKTMLKYMEVAPSNDFQSKNFYIFGREISISGTSISTSNNLYGFTAIEGGYCARENRIFIVRVDGYR